MEEGKRRLPLPLIILIIYSLLIFLLITLLQHYPRIMTPIFFAAVTAYLVNPLVNRIEKKTRLPRTLITAILILLLVSIVVLILVFILPYLVEQTQKAARRIPDLVDQMDFQIQRFNSFLHRTFPGFTTRINLAQEVEKSFQKLKANFSQQTLGLFSNLYDMVLSIIFMIILPLFSFYFIRDSHKIRKNLLSLIPSSYIDQFLNKARQINGALSHFIRGQVIVVLILIILYCTGLSLLNVPFALVIGIFAGLGDIIPYFGTIVGLITSLLLTLVEFQSMEKILLVILLFAVVKGTENWYFYPKIVGKEIGLHILWVLVSLIFFGQFFGFWGLVVAIPSAALFKIFLSDVIHFYKHSHFFGANDRPE